MTEQKAVGNGKLCKHCRYSYQINSVEKDKRQEREEGQQKKRNKKTKLKEGRRIEENKKG